VALWLWPLKDRILKVREGAAMRIAMNGERLRILLATAAACIISSGVSAQTQPSKAPAQSDQSPPPLIRSVDGAELFRAYCAPCHGLDAKGKGPAAVALKAPVPDLTTLAKRNRGNFPEVRVRKAITGEDAVAAHGSREMPIWGPVLHQIEADVDRGNVRLDNLVKYLRSIQAP
jgi:mono/diheme cytochrome c family protein